MSGGKGKERANGDEDTDNSPTAGQPCQGSSSMFERVTASAASLARSAFTVPNSNELSDSASAALINAGKGEQVAGSRSSAWAESSRVSQQTSLPTLQGQPPPSFRAGHREEHVQNAEAEFSSFLDGIDSFQPFTETHATADLPPGQIADGPLGGINISTYTGSDQTKQSAYNSVDEQQRHDGEGVLAILSDPSPTAGLLDAWPVEEEAVSWNLTDQQVSNLRAVMNELFPLASPHISSRADHPLNLIPVVASTSTAVASLPLTDAHEEESYMYFGQRIPGETARQMWMDQWEGVLTRYTDEVWGDLLPLVREAREEIDAMKEEPPTDFAAQPRALRRLQLILDHLRKS